MSPSNILRDRGGGGSGNGVNYIEHPVSKFDTLAGVAIKYGVEVADIKRMNNLATDLQMFALKTLRIPLPGRHPPSNSPPNGSANLGEDITQGRPRHLGQSSMQEPFQSLRLKAPRQKFSMAMSTLQDYYGLKSSHPRGKAEETEMAVYRSSGSDHFSDESLQKASPPGFDPPSNHLCKSRNLSHDLLSDFMPRTEIGNGAGDKSDEKSVRRRQKAEVDSGAGTPERSLKEENNGATNGFSSSTGKGSAMRPKSASRTVLAEPESSWLDSIPIGLGESIMTDGFSAVRKSSSASSLKEQEKNYSATGWSPAKWSLKSDLQALSTAAIAKPIFDGLPLSIPISGRRNKAALD
ncbi:hypothetical protein L6164_006304 [Bauhinia variegata]|uniref:Uncharacterized protein n=1 Tax=Bauhinia variegata TaxID=167791 RepID=A0ACB9PVG1_BAUVA|nr:hypothetical protein L6164_006304 [Bauhinia variegata]